MTPPEKLTPERAVRLLRAKVGELEHTLLEVADDPNTMPTDLALAYIGADIALVATLLAEHMERTEALLRSAGEQIDWLRRNEQTEPESVRQARLDHNAWVEEAFQSGEITREQYDAWKPKRDERIDYGPQFGEEEDASVGWDKKMRFDVEGS